MLCTEALVHLLKLGLACLTIVWLFLRRISYPFLECKTGYENVDFTEQRMFTLLNIKYPKSRMCFQKTACLQKNKTALIFFKWPKYSGLPMVCLVRNENQQFAYKWKLS